MDKRTKTKIDSYLKLDKTFERVIPDEERPTTHYLHDYDVKIKAKRAIMKDINEVMKMITDMSWKEISFSVRGESYTVVLPKPIIVAMKKLYNGTSPAYSTTIPGLNNSTRNSIFLNYVTSHFSTGSYSFMGSNPNSSNSIKMKIDSDNRTHFPNDGISPKLRGSGLGKKLYRALIEQKPWVRTYSSGSTEKNWLWAGLSDEQYDKHGNRDRDAEIYSFRFSSTHFAVSTTRPDNIEAGYDVISRIADKSVLNDKQARKNAGIGIDADFVELCKRNLDNPKAALVVGWMDDSPENRERMRAARAEQERIEREERERTERERSQRITNVLNAYCGVTNIAHLSHDWEVGDWVTLKAFLTQETPYNNLPVRLVVKKEGNTYAAIKPSDFPAFARNGSLNDVRNTSTKDVWVKALPPAEGFDYPPAMWGVPASAPRRTTFAPIRTEQLIGFTTGRTVAAGTGPTNVPTPAANLGTGILSHFTLTTDRETTYNFPSPTRKRVLMRPGHNFVYVPKPETLARDNKIQDTAIFGFWISGERTKTVVNTKTLETSRIQSADIPESDLVKYKRVPVGDKTDFSAGDLAFIKSHSRYFGYVARVINTAVVGSRGDRYVYLRVPGAPGNKLTLTITGLEKLVPVTNESAEMSPGPVFESYLDKVKNEALTRSITKRYFEDWEIENMRYGTHVDQVLAGSGIKYAINTVYTTAYYTEKEPQYDQSKLVSLPGTEKPRVSYDHDVKLWRSSFGY
jgi:hypothetical protein